MRSFIIGSVLAVAALAAPAHAADVGAQLELGKFAISKGLFNAVFAKEYCSCVFVDRLPLAECKANDNLPDAADLLVVIKVDQAAKTVSSRHNLLAVASAFAGVTPGPKATAKFMGERFGCVLTEGPAQ